MVAISRFVPGGGAVDLITYDNYGEPDVELSSASARSGLSVLIRYMDSVGRPASVSARIALSASSAY